jgi:hypothetical protein
MWLVRRLWVTWFLERRVLREAGFTEQRLPPALGSGRITGQWHPNSTRPAGLNSVEPSLFFFFIFNFTKTLFFFFFFFFLDNCTKLENHVFGPTSF